MGALLSAMLGFGACNMIRRIPRVLSDDMEASLASIAVVTAESFTNAFGWDRSASEPPAANTRTDRRIALIVRKSTANRLSQFP